MGEMTNKDERAFRYFMAQHKRNWDLNQYYRTQHDENLESYLGYSDERKTPMAYNLHFNKLMPRIHTVMSRLLGQLYQAGTGEMASVRPRKRQDVDRAPRVQGLLNYQLESLNDCDMQGGSFLHNLTWMYNAITFGKGVSKLYWKKEDRIAPRRMEYLKPVFDNAGRMVSVEPDFILLQDMQTVYDGPYAEVIHNKLFNPHPHYKSIQKMPFVSIIYRRTVDYIKRKAQEGVFNGKYIKNLAWTDSHVGKTDVGDSFEAICKSLEIEGATFLHQGEMEQIEETGRTPEVDIIEGYGRYIFPEDEGSYEVGSGLKIKGQESEAIVHIGNYKTLLSLKKNTYGTRGLFDIGAYQHPELYWDIGLVKLGKAVQEQYNNMGNMRFQNVMLGINSMLKVRQDADVDPAALTWKPFGIVPVEEMDDVQPLVVPDMFQSGAFQQMEQFFEETISDMTGLYPYNMGQTPNRQEHVGTITSLQSMGEARTKLLMMTMDHTGFRPFLKHMMLLNTWHLDPKTEARINTSEGTQFQPLFAGDFHPDYDFSARYTGMEPSLGKQFRAQQLIQYAQMFAQSPFTQHYQFQKAILELLDFHDSDRYLKTPQMVAQEGQARAKQEVEMQIFSAGLQDQLAAKDDERTLQREVVKGLLK